MYKKKSLLLAVLVLGLVLSGCTGNTGQGGGIEGVGSVLAVERMLDGDPTFFVYHTLNEGFAQVEIEIEPILLSSGNEFMATGFVYVRRNSVGRLLVDGEFLANRMADSKKLKCSLITDGNENGIESCSELPELEEIARLAILQEKIKIK